MLPYFDNMKFNACLSFSVTLALSGDVVPLRTPGEYVVPKGGTVTFTCNSSSFIVPTWQVEFKALGRTSGPGFNTIALLEVLRNVNSTDNASDGFPNPTSFTVHNIPEESNGSYVKCSANILASSKAIIIVEGEYLHIMHCNIDRAIMWSLHVQPLTHSTMDIVICLHFI